MAATGITSITVTPRSLQEWQLLAGAVECPFGRECPNVQLVDDIVLKRRAAPALSSDQAYKAGSTISVGPCTPSGRKRDTGVGMAGCRRGCRRSDRRPRASIVRRLKSFSVAAHWDVLWRPACAQQTQGDLFGRRRPHAEVDFTRRERWRHKYRSEWRSSLWLQTELFSTRMHKSTPDILREASWLPWSQCYSKLPIRSRISLSVTKRFGFLTALTNLSE